MKYLSLLLLLCLSLSLTSQTTVSIPAAKDNTMFSEDGTLSNGAGPYFYAGQINNAIAFRRALIQFDLSSIPAGAMITNAVLEVTGSMGGPNQVRISRLIADWGEAGSIGAGAGGGQGGPAQPGDATWTFNFFNISDWNNAGGDFNLNPSAGGMIASGVTTQITSADMINEVIAWHSGLTPNFGWVIIGEEGTQGSAVRMNSRENLSNPPVLKVTYEEKVARVIINELNVTDQWVEIYNPNDVNVDITGWYLCNRPAYAQIGGFGNISLIAGVLDMPPDSYTVLRWPGIGMPPDAAELGLYRSNQYNNPADMEDYVQYHGILSPSRAAVAVSAGVWASTMDFIPALSNPAANTFSLKIGPYTSGVDTDLDDWWEQVPTFGEINPYCIYALNITGIVPNGMSEASFEITSDGTVVMDDNVSFLAGNHIELKGGFTVEPGAMFLADINLCQ